MKKHKLALLLAFAPLFAAAAAPAYRVDVLATDGWSGYGDLNNAGQALIVRGSQTSTHSTLRTYLTTKESSIDLGTLGGSSAISNDLNNSGFAAGYSTIAGNAATHAFVYANGTMRDLGTLGGTNSYATAINDAGTVVGRSQDASGAMRGFVYTEQAGMTDIGTLGGAQTEIMDISETGEILGRSQTASGEWHDFLYKDGVMKDVDDWNGWLTGFGPNGEIYGYTYNWRDESEIVMYRSDWWPGLASATKMADGYMVGLDSSGTLTYLSSREGTWSLNQLAGGEWMFFNVEGVNDHGQVLAQGCIWGDNGYCANLLLSPIPEPATYAMLGAGLGLVALARRRKAAVTRSA